MPIRADRTLPLWAELDAIMRLHELAHRLLAYDDLPVALDQVLLATMEITGATGGKIELLGTQDDAREIVAQRGLGPGRPERFRAACVDEAIRSGARVMIEDLQAAPGPEPHSEPLLAAGCRAVQATPLVSRTGTRLGALATYYARPYRPSPRELRVLDLCARQAADFIERQRIETALRESEERYRAVAERSPDAILVNSSGRFAYANTAAAALLGAPSAAALIGRPVLDFVDPQYHDLVRGRVHRVLRGDGPAPRLEYRWRRWDGTPAEVEVSSSRFVWDGEPAVLVTARDITERKRTDEALARSERQSQAELADTRLLQKISDQLIVHEDVDALYETILEAAIEITRADRGTMQILDAGTGELHLLAARGMAADVWQTYARVAARTSCAVALRQRERVIVDYATDPRVAGTEDARLHLEAGIRSAQSTPLLTRSGRLVGMITTHWGEPRVPSDRDLRLLDILVRQAADLIERAQAEQTLRESQRILQGIMEYVPEGITVADAPDASIRMVSRYGLEIAGRPAEALLDRPAASHPETWGIFHPDGTPAGASELPLTRAVQQGEVVINEEWLLRRPDGSQVTVLCNAGPIRSPDGTISGGIVAWRDITELKRAQQVLEDADRRKDDFLATLGHELRNPLGAIRMALQVAQVARGDAAQMEKTLAVVDRQSLQLVRLIDDLLDVSRISLGKIELQKQRAPLASIIAQPIETMRALCERHDVELTAVLPAQPIVLEADAVRIGQVIGNLVHNACKYTPPGGRVCLLVELAGDQAVMRVQDTGQGIAPDQLPRLFQMFGQLDPERDRGKGGLGVGLALSKRLVEMHGGTIEARSEGPGRGAEFIVRLPAARGGSEANDRETGDDAGTRSASPRRRILAVDDNPDALHTLTAYLRLRGHEVIEANNGEQALEAAESHLPEIIFLDIGLPGIDGYEVARRIREQSWGRSLNMIAMTGRGQEQDRRRAAGVGFNAHLTKPAEIDAIERILAAPARAAAAE